MKEYPITYIDDINDLNNAVSIWESLDSIGIDLECENNLHHYGVYISLIQLSDGMHHWIIDAIALRNKDLSKLVAFFENKKIQKIFHDVNFDLRILSKDFNCHPKNVFDTQIAAKYLGKTEIGLGALLEEYFGFDKKKQFQKADWTKRPLTPAMIKYAASDAIYLIKLRDFLIKELKQLDRLIWVKEECSNIETKDLDYHMSTFMDLKGLRHIHPIARGIAKALYDLREIYAKQVDRPIYFVFSNKRLMEFSSEGVHSISFWQKLGGVHPIVKKHAKLFYDAERRGKLKPIEIPESPRMRLKSSQKEIVNNLYDLREKLALEFGLKSHLFITKEQMVEVAVQNSISFLSDWQQKIFSKYLEFE